MEERKYTADLRAALILTFFGLSATATGFLREVAIAFFLGTTAQADAYSTVMFVWDALTVIILNGLAGYTTVPFLERARREGDEAYGVGTVLSLGLWFSLCSLALSVVIYFFAQDIISALLPSLTPAQQQQTASLLSFCALIIAPLVITNFIFSVLRAFYRFNVVPVAKVIFNFAVIVSTIILHNHIGLLGVGVGIVSGTAIQLSVAIFQLKRIPLAGLRINLIDSRIAALLKMMWIPLLVVLLPNFLNAFEFYLLSGLGEGRIAGVKYAQRLMNVSGAIVASVQVVFFAKMGREADAEDQSERKIAIAKKAMTWGLFILVPLSLLISALAHPLVTVMFQRGAFGGESTALTAGTLSIYALGFAAQFIVGTCYYLCFSLDKSRLSLLTIVLLTLFSAGIMVACLPWFGHLSVPLGYTAGLWIAAMAALMIMNNLSGEKRIGLALLGRLLVYGLLSLAPLIPVLYGFWGFDVIFDKGFLGSLAYIAFSSCCFLIVYLTLTCLINPLQSRTMLVEMINKVIVRKARNPEKQDER